MSSCCICRPNIARRKSFPITTATGKPLRARRWRRIFKALQTAGWPGGSGILAGRRRRLGPRASRQQTQPGQSGFSASSRLENAGPHRRCRRRLKRGMPHSPRQAPGLASAEIPTGFDGLCWAIIGQQINVPFAASLRREILRMAGETVGDMRTHPTPERVANLNLVNLNKRRFSRSKADYLIGAGRKWRKASSISKACRTAPPSPPKRSYRASRHRHMDGALRHAARWLRRCRAGW